MANHLCARPVSTLSWSSPTSLNLNNGRDVGFDPKLRSGTPLARFHVQLKDGCLSPEVRTVPCYVMHRLGSSIRFELPGSRFGTVSARVMPCWPAWHMQSSPVCRRRIGCGLGLRLELRRSECHPEKHLGNNPQVADLVSLEIA